MVLLDSESDALDAGLPIALLASASLPADLSPAPGVFAPPSAASKGLPGVFGVLPDPKDANAPEPSPNALDAPPPPPGEATLGVGTLLKGFVLPCDELSPPKRLLEKEALRLVVPASAPFWLVAKESLFELRRGGKISI